MQLKIVYIHTHIKDVSQQTHEILIGTPELVHCYKIPPPPGRETGALMKKFWNQVMISTQRTTNTEARPSSVFPPHVYGFIVNRHHPSAQRDLLKIEGKKMLQ